MTHDDYTTKKKVFVTVGTTKFDELIETVVSSDILKALNRHGYNHLTVQIGKSLLDVDCTPRHGFQCIEFFTLSPSIQQQMSSADLVISHAGAGSCLEALETCKPLIVVTNELLMDNHQLELAEQLFNDGHLYYCTCDTLLDVITVMNLGILKPLQNTKIGHIVNFIDLIMGF